MTRTENATIAAPIADLIATVATGLADAQHQLDLYSLEQAEALRAATEGGARRLHEAGYRPSWYHIPEAEATLTLSMAVRGDQEAGGGRLRLLGIPVDASFQNRFSVEVAATSTVRFKIVSVPPPPGLDEPER